MRFVLVSDTHGGHARLDLPPGDLLIHAGDATHGGDMEALHDFAEWLNRQSHPERVAVAGNHDWCFERDGEAARRALAPSTYLEDSPTTIDGVKMYGSPWQPRFGDHDEQIWAFDRPRGAPLADKWARIPEETDILVTHAPPHGILDDIYTGDAIGCRELRDRVEEVEPALHVFGHVHEQPGATRIGKTLFVNAAMPGGYGDPAIVDCRREDGEVVCELVDPGDEYPEWLQERMEEKRNRH